MPLTGTTGGLKIHRDIDLDEATPTSIRAGNTKVHGWVITNNAASDMFVKFYNTGVPTVGTTAPVITINITAAETVTFSSEEGIGFDTGLSVAATTGVADNDTGAPGANEVVANIFYS